MSSVVFAVFDFQIGSIPAFSTLGEEAAKKVSLKSQLTLAMTKENNIADTDAVIPFPDLGKIGYVYLFTMPSKDEQEKFHVASITYLIDKSDQIELFQQIIPLRHEAEIITKNIRKQLTYTKGMVVPQNIQQMIREWGSSLEKTTISLEEKYVERKITIQTSKAEASVPFLFNQIKKPLDFEHLITALLVGKPIFISCSNKSIIEVAIASLEAFVPHRTLRKIMYTNEFVLPDEADIIGINRYLIRFYSSEIIFDLDKHRVSSGDRSVFVERLLRDLNKKDHQSALEIIHTRVTWLLDNVSQLTEAFAVSDKTEQETIIRKVMKDAPDALNIIIEIAASTSPAIEARLRSEMGRWREKVLNFAKRGW